MPRPSEGVLVSSLRVREGVLVGSLRVREKSEAYRIGAVARVST